MDHGSGVAHPADTDGRVVGHDVIVLAGGGGTRLGGVDKAALEVGGRPLLHRVLEGTRRARRVVVVGATAVPDGVLRTVEDPPGGGPVAGIAAGLAALRQGSGLPEWTVVLAVDQPGAGQAVSGLLAAAATAAPDTDLVCPHDDEGHPQWLLAAYRTAALTRALEPLGTGHHVSVRRLVSALTIADAAVVGVGDIDTWEDHAAWHQRLSGEPDATQ
ncbi:MAG: NTP transferase domain-containing protein [Actinomycetales bacterium]|nr:NTP transferase domain-containing protein [Actinomycetales bacterium]